MDSLAWGPLLDEETVNEKDDDADDDNDEHYEKELLVIANRFPEELNFFCNPRNELMRDRICYGQLDAYALACADDTPPLYLVPFCFAFKHQCSTVTYPSDDWCVREFDHYRNYCTRTRRSKCKSCDYDLSCYCEPYECVWRRFGYDSAVWCQRYELFCDEKERRRKATELVTIMEAAVKIHYKCMHLFNLPKVICNPLRRQFDYNRCIKFLFDCELISDFDSELESLGKEISPEEAHKEGKEAPQKILPPSPEDKELAAEIAKEEVELEKVLMEKEEQDKQKHGEEPPQMSSSNSTVPTKEESTTSAPTPSVSTRHSLLEPIIKPPKNPFDGIVLISRNH